MATCVNKCIDRYYTIDIRVKELESTCVGCDILAKGSICLLKRSLKKCSIQLKSFKCFLKHTVLPDLESMLQFIEDKEIIAEDSNTSRDSEEENEQVFLRLADSLSMDDVDDDDDDYDDDTLESKLYYMHYCNAFCDHFAAPILTDISDTHFVSGSFGTSASMCKIKLILIIIT